MNTSELVEWQRIDLTCGLVEPWLTHPFMDMVKHWDLATTTVLETGGGRSTAWWRHHCRWVDTIEANSEWGTQIAEDCNNYGLHNGRLLCETIPDGTEDGMKKYFSLIPTDKQYDIVIVDGIYRTEMLEWAVKHLRGRGGVVIADNYQQDYVWISPKAEEIMKSYLIYRFVQPDHTNHEGRPWNTSYWIVR